MAGLLRFTGGTVARRFAEARQTGEAGERRRAPAPVAGVRHGYRRQARAARLLGMLAGSLLLLMACAPRATPTPTVIPTTAYVRVLVTRPPTATLTFTPSPTLPYDIGDIPGTWTLNVTYTLRGGAVFDNVRFTGSAALEVDPRGNIRGSIDFYPLTFVPTCSAAILDELPLSASLGGTLRPGADGQLIADLRYEPTDPSQRTTLWLFCVDFTEAVQRQEALLWPALRAVSDLRLSLVMQPGTTTSTADLNGPGQGGVRGLLFSEFTLMH